MIRLKPFRQTPAFCGPACLKIVFHYNGVFVSERKIAKIAGATKERGASADDLKKAAEHFGFNAFWKTDSTTDDLRHYIEKGIPVIVDWFCEDDGHYSIVVDIDETDKGEIVLRDPSFSRIRRKSIKKFLGVWFDYPDDQPNHNFIERLILVVTPKE